MFKVSIEGLDELKKKLDNIGPKIKLQAKESITKLCVMMVARVKSQKLSGQKLKVKSGRLRRSITYKVSESGPIVTGQVGTNVQYAAVHEFGFNGTVNVKAHMREIRQAFGKPIDAKEVMVKAHTKKMNIPENSFLRSTLEEMEPEVKKEFEGIVKRALK